jgi:mannosyltransferase
MMRRIFTTVVIILALAAALRFYRLDAQSFWNDEGTSARVAERSLPLVTAAAIGDIHPPLYYYALHFWRGLVGASELALRSLSALLGILLVWLIYVLGRQLLDEPAALIAALVAAINPLQVYYSQEARMYMLLAVWAAASTYFLVLWLKSSSGRQDAETFEPARRPGILIGYVLAAAAGMYTHYAFPFILVAHNLSALAWLAAQRAGWRKLAIWIGVQAAVVVLYLPWLGIALARIPEWQSPAPAYQLGPALVDTLRWFVFGRTIPTAPTTVALGAVGLFVLAALYGRYLPGALRTGDGARSTLHTPLSTLLLLTWWLVPVALIFAFGLYKEAYLKFLLVCSPAFCLLLGRGVITAWRTVSRRALRVIIILLLALLATLTLQSLSNLYFDPAYARDNYRGIAQRIRQEARPGDAILLEAPNQWEAFTYYYGDEANVIPLARVRPVTEQAAAQELSQITARYRRLFVLYWAETEPDPNRYVERWLNANTYKASESWFGTVRLAVYAPPAALAAHPDHALDVRFGDAVRLDGYSLAADSVVPGDTLQLALFWEAQAPIAVRYKVFVHVLDAGDRIMAQIDREPGGELVPTTIWQPGQTIVDRYGVPIPPDAAPGRYRIAVGLYGFDGVRLSVQGTAQDRVILGEVIVAR